MNASDVQVGPGGGLPGRAGAVRLGRRSLVSVRDDRLAGDGVEKRNLGWLGLLGLLGLLGIPLDNLGLFGLFGLFGFFSFFSVFGRKA